MSDVLIAGIHRPPAQSPSHHTGELIAEYRVLANRCRRAYLAIVTVRCASEIAVVHGPPRTIEPEVVDLSICRVGSEREVPRGSCRDELGAAIRAAVLAEHTRRAA
jgi:hypothetical protein